MFGFGIRVFRSKNAVNIAPNLNRLLTIRPMNLSIKWSLHLEISYMEKSTRKRKQVDEDGKENEIPTDKKKRMHEEVSDPLAESTKCSVCLDTVQSQKMKSLLCAHVFHEICINKWLEKSNVCPICRHPSQIDTDDSSRMHATGLREWRGNFESPGLQANVSVTSGDFYDNSSRDESEDEVDFGDAREYFSDETNEYSDEANEGLSDETNEHLSDEDNEGLSDETNEHLSDETNEHLSGGTGVHSSDDISNFLSGGTNEYLSRGILSDGTDESLSDGTNECSSDETNECLSDGTNECSSDDYTRSEEICEESTLSCDDCSDANYYFSDDYSESDQLNDYGSDDYF